MQTLVYVNPLKPGKRNEYKAFSAENLGPRKKEYIDLLKRYGLKTAKVYYHKLGNKEFVIVIHEAEDDATERLAHFPTSKHPYDRWFFEQLVKLHDFESYDSAHGSPYPHQGTCAHNGSDYFSGYVIGPSVVNRDASSEFTRIQQLMSKRILPSDNTPQTFGPFKRNQLFVANV